MSDYSMTRLGSSGLRPKTPARPLYAARLPPIHHPLGAEGENGEATHSEPIITTSLQPPKIRPTTARPVGTQLSAKTSMAGMSPTGLKPLPAIGEPYKKPISRSRVTKTTPVRTALKCLVICMFLSIPVLIFIVMMVLSGGFAPINLDEEVPPVPPGMSQIPPPGNLPPPPGGQPPPGGLPSSGNPPSPGMSQGPPPPTAALPPPSTTQAAPLVTPSSLRPVTMPNATKVT